MNIKVESRWQHGKLAVLDLEGTGSQIGEKLFNLLNTEQQYDLIDFILEVEKLTAYSADLPRASMFRSIFPNSANPLTEIHVSDLYFCLEEHRVSVCGRQIDLTAREFDALHLLIINQKRVITFEIIAYRIWGEEYINVTPKTIHNLMSRLRHKLQVDPSGPEYVKSVRGVDYTFEAK